jgi:DNA-binding NtrC family response regulator
MGREDLANVPAVVLVDDEPSVLLAGESLLRSAGIKPVLTLQDSRELLPLLERRSVSVVVLDLTMPYVSGMDLLPQIQRAQPDAAVIVMTATQAVDTAVACMKGGAFDYLLKPVEENRLVSAVKRALEIDALRREVGALKRYLLDDELRHPEAFATIVTGHRKMRALFQYLEAVAGSLEPVLITGETGVGKELFAETVHRISRRAGKFVQVNVAGLDDDLFSDTLFGHRKGAFTGAAEAREGLVAQAAGGTLFLDEIGDLTTASQVKLLRLLQEQMYYPLGSDVARNSDVRVVFATNHDLRRRMEQGAFRDDLFYRMAVHQIHIPPLRERSGDIPLLVSHFLEQAASSMGRETPGVPHELFTLLANYPFPGNVRQLRSMVFDAMALHQGGGVLSLMRFKRQIEAQRDRTGGVATSQKGAGGGAPLLVAEPFPTLKDAENFLMDEALRRAGGNQGVAAMLLGISRPALNRRLSRRGN